MVETDKKRMHQEVTHYTVEDELTNMKQVGGFQEG